MAKAYLRFYRNGTRFRTYGCNKKEGHEMFEKINSCTNVYQLRKCGIRMRTYDKIKVELVVGKLKRVKGKYVFVKHKMPLIQEHGGI